MIQINTNEINQAITYQPIFTYKFASLHIPPVFFFSMKTLINFFRSSNLISSVKNSDHDQETYRSEPKRVRHKD